MAETAKVMHLKGDPRKPESSEHIIKFPGGCISVCRTSDNEYWAHITAYKGTIIDDTVRESKNGCITNSRIDYTYEKYKELTAKGECGIGRLPDEDSIEHLAVRISTK